MKIIIFSEWVKMCKIIEIKLRKILKETHIYLIVGKTDNKFDNLQKFRDDNYNSILICSDCLSYGFNIPEVDILIHYDLSFSPAKIEQRIGRADRMNRTNGSLLVFNLLIKDSIEDRVVELLMGKQAMFSTVVEGQNSFNTAGILRELFGRKGKV